jgi:hypothetical protein
MEFPRVGGGSYRHVNGTAVATNLCEMWDSTTMVQMEVADDYSIDNLGVILASRDVFKVWESSFVIVSHMHSTIEHDISASKRYNNAGPTDILSGTWNRRGGLSSA